MLPDHAARSMLCQSGNALICTLRQAYGAGFAPRLSGDEKLSDVPHDLDERSLTHPIKDLQKKPTLS